MADPFRWLPYDGRRHAIPYELVGERDGYTLCGEFLTVPLDAWADPVRRCWPTCLDCDDTWRKHEGIGPRRSADLDPNGGVRRRPAPNRAVS